MSVMVPPLLAPSGNSPWRRNSCRIEISPPSGVLQAIGHAADDITQPRMCRLVVQPPQPNHGNFDRLLRTCESAVTKLVGPCHAFGGVERKHRYQVRCGKDKSRRQEWRTQRRSWAEL